MIRKWIYKLRYILIIGSALLGLLGASGSFGYVYTVGVEYSYNYGDWENSSFLVDSQVNFPFAYPMTFSRGPCIGMKLFWNNGELNFIATNAYNISSCDTPKQMLVGKYTNICKVPYTENAGCINDGRITYGGCDLNSKCSGKNVDIEEFYNTTGTLSSISFENEMYGSYSRSFCFNYEDIDTSYCVLFNTINNTISVGQSYDSVDNITISNAQAMRDFVSPSPDSPFAGGGGSASYTGFDISNKLLLRSYEEIGYNKNVCYGGVIKSDYSAFIPGTGYTLFQLYDQFSGSFSNILDWYNYYRDGYINYPRIGDSGSVFNIDGVFQTPLYGLFYLASINGVSLFPSQDIIDYCDLLINKCSDLESETCSSLYTGDKTGLDYLLSWKGKFSYTLSGNQIVYDSEIFNVLSGENKDFDPSTFFSDLLTKFQSGFSGIDLSIVGIIPGYILAFMFALILIRMLSK